MAEAMYHHEKVRHRMHKMRLISLRCFMSQSIFQLLFVLKSKIRGLKIINVEREKRDNLPDLKKDILKFCDKNEKKVLSCIKNDYKRRMVTFNSLSIKRCSFVKRVLSIAGKEWNNFIADFQNYVLSLLIQTEKIKESDFIF